ncbi:MAG: YCF48-related protein [Candidatus Binatia bacterium]
MRAPRCLRLLLGLVAVAAGTGCHGKVEEVPFVSRLINISDKFYDVQAIDADHAVVVGYAGKILLTADGGFTWSRADSGTDRALYRVRFVDAQTGWVSGQDGVILHTVDGGQTWQRQHTGTTVYLFSEYFLDRNHGWAVGDKSIYLETRDGGATWSLHKITTAAERALSPEQAIASQDPVLYDVQFLDARTGWVVGEFGKIFHTSDGGHIWSEQEQSLLGTEVVDILDLPTLFGLHFVDRQTGIAAGLDGRIVRTEDGGASWRFEKMKLRYPIIDPLFYPVLFPDGTGWAIGAAGEVVHLATAGGQWQRADLGMEVVTWLRGMSWLNEQNGWMVGGFGLILHTKDGGKIWIPSLG